ncbi:MAG: barstar family protein [Actinobacteria bacterium]|nr:barstar family protein [Actinomycetota bacterium]
MAGASRYRLTAVTGSGILDRSGFLACLAVELSFPSWFGMNWDALADALGDRWDATGEVLVLRSFSGFQRAAPRDWASACGVLAAAAAESRSSWVLVTGAAGRGLRPLLALSSGAEPDHE